MTQSAVRGREILVQAESAETFAADEVRAQLQKILESRFFRSSKRCSAFLERVVAHSLSDSPEPLKERTLGIHVFGRQPTYDTSVDPIVRVTAGEVRRRLGQYYAEEAHQLELRIDLLAGSYAPTYWKPRGTRTPPEQSEAPPPNAPRPVRNRLLLWSVGAFAVGALALALLTGLRQTSTALTLFDRFWAPLFDAPVPVLLCPGGLDMYELPQNLKEAADAAASGRGVLEPLRISPAEVTRVGTRYVAIGDAVAIARIASLFQERRRPYRIREHNLTSFADLRASPTVLIGMFSNTWTLQLGAGFRFVPTIEGDGHHVGIIDRQQPDKSFRIPRPWPSLKLTHDYALISRVFDRATGTIVLTAGGVTPYGTAAAGEFVTSPDHLERALSSVTDWANRNLQLVLETQVIDGAASAPRVVASHVW